MGGFADVGMWGFLDEGIGKWRIGYRNLLVDFCAYPLLLFWSFYCLLKSLFAAINEEP
jgi:hypothetical protein